MTLLSLRRALDMITVGEAASVPQALQAEAVALFQEAQPWVRGKGIQGFGISDKITDGKIIGPPVLKVYVENKLPKSKLRQSVPEFIHISSLDRSVVTDVEAIGLVQAETYPNRLRPAIPGCGLAHIKVTVGTFGCLVRKVGTTRPIFILSNSHVLARSGFGRKGDEIIQPGKYDGGKPINDKIAELSDFIPFDESPTGFTNLVDAAIARTKATLVRPPVRLIGPIAGVGRVVRRGMKVQKVGRTTDHTIGEIRDIDFRTRIDYTKPNGRGFSAGFRNQVLCTRYTAGGDSGSAVLTRDRKIIGLHFAGSPSTSIFNRISAVLGAFDVEVITE